MEHVRRPSPRGGVKRGLAVAGTLLASALAVPATADRTGGDRYPGVRVLDLKGAQTVRCPPIEVDGLRVTGGCLLEEAAQRVDVTVATAIGEFRVAKCDFYLGVAVDGDGRAVVDSFSHVGGPPCGYVEACHEGHDPLAAPPLEGRLYLDPRGRLHQYVHMCLDTHLGRFEGGLDVTLHDERGEWWSKDVRTSVGGSGWGFDGRWRLKRNINDRQVLRDKSVYLSVERRR